MANDFALAICALSSECTDSDALEDDEEALEGSKALVQAIIDANGALL